MGHLILENLSSCGLNDKRHLRQEPVTNPPPPPSKKNRPTPLNDEHVSVKFVVNLDGKAYTLLLEPSKDCPSKGLNLQLGPSFHEQGKVNTGIAMGIHFSPQVESSNVMLPSNLYT